MLQRRCCRASIGSEHLPAGTGSLRCGAHGKGKQAYQKRTDVPQWREPKHLGMKTTHLSLEPSPWSGSTGGAGQRVVLVQGPVCEPDLARLERKRRQGTCARGRLRPLRCSMEHRGLPRPSTTFRRRGSSRGPELARCCGMRVVCSPDKMNCARKKVSVDTLLCFMMHRVQKSRAESLMANSSIFVLKNKFWKKMQSRTEMVTA